MKKVLVFLSIALFVLSCNLGFAREMVGSKDLIASLPLLPGLADSPEKGTLVEIVKAMDDVYPGKIKIEVYPFQRSIANVIEGKADFHIPNLSGPGILEDKNPFRFVTEKVGTVSLVIYSNVDQKITKKEINDALAKGGQFPYVIEGAGLPFVVEVRGSESAVRKLIAKRIDAVLMPQEDVDAVIRQLKAKTIYRSLWGNFYDSVVIPKGPKGDELDPILSDCLRKLKASGRLQKLYGKIHLPFYDWQPANMGW